MKLDVADRADLLVLAGPLVEGAAADQDGLRQRAKDPRDDIPTSRR
jgi:hypothetical protein